MSLSLLRRGLLQSRWVKTRGGWEEGKIKARGKRWEGERKKRLPRFPHPVVPRAPVFSLQCFCFPLFSFTKEPLRRREIMPVV